jgi:C4-dicarboxylate-specific signal transduction histidine kinase
LQSINEELETAKEELQATNEEMASVNDELENRNTDLRQSRDFALSIVNNIRHPLLVLGMDRRVMSANRSFYSEFHTSPEETEGRSFFELGDGHFDIPELRTRLDKVLYHEDSFENFEFDGDCARIGRRVILFSASRLTALQMVLLTMEDITVRRDMESTLRSSEEQLRQSQKLEAVGRLAGGIAHDFNNLLTVVMGHSDMLLAGATGEALDREALAAIRSAGERGASLTQQLLAFSRRQVLQPKVLDLGDLIAEFERMLRRLIGEHIELIVNCSPALWRVKADPGQVGRVIMNLALNARDAMPQGGTLTMELGNVRLNEAGAAERKLTPVSSSHSLPPRPRASARVSVCPWSSGSSNRAGARYGFIRKPDEDRPSGSICRRSKNPRRARWRRAMLSAKRREDPRSSYWSRTKMGCGSLAGASWRGPVTR